MSKYKVLWDHVQKRGDMPLKLTFDKIKDITGAEIDHSFLKYKKELIEYGCEVKKISLKEQFIIFDRT